MPLVTCVRCQVGNSSDSKFCKNCGLHLLESPMLGRFIPRGIPGMEGEIVISQLPFTIGRGKQNDLLLNLNSVSRQHASLELREGKTVLTDSGSVNGTFVNGTRISTIPIADGDRVRIGNAEFDFRADSGWSSDPQGQPQERRLGLLLEVAKAINSSLILEDVLQLVMNSVMKVSGSDRGFLLIEEHPGDLKFAVMHTGASSQSDSEEPKISMSTVNKVFESGMAMVSIDVASDTDIRSQLSVVNLGLRSIMCVPLKTKNGTLGIIYVDSNRKSKNFTQEDLRVLEALADHAAIAIENAQLQKSLLETQRIEQELEFAAIIQKSFLPANPPDLKPYRLNAKNLSAKTVGGDFYDFLSLTDRRLGIAIGDVSGKGIPAALFMARLISDFRFLARSEADPAATMTKMNEQLVRRSRRGMFVTMLYMVLDIQLGEATCVNAGHLPILLQNREGVHALHQGSGIPLGILPDTTFESFSFRFEPGDRALLYTDGIVEAINLAGKRYTLDAIRDYMSHAPEDAVLADSLFQEVQGFAGGAPQHDDMTLLSIHRLT